MITPRRTRLCRVPNLAAFRTKITDRIAALPPDEALDTLFLVPTGAAAEQLRRTVEDRVLRADRAALAWPLLATRREFYDELAGRLPAPLAMLSPYEREVIVAAVARDATARGLAPPFQMRPSLIAEIVGLYDQIRRLGRTVDHFERNLGDELAREEDTDRGAARLLQQTRFLAAVYRAYESYLDTSGRSDEHRLREALLQTTSTRPLRRVVVTVPDQLAGSDGLWPADFDLLTRLPELQSVDIISTESLLSAGFLERLYVALPGLEEVRDSASALRPPVLVTSLPTPTGTPDSVVLTHRDREEELGAVARRLKSERRTQSAAPLHRTALVVRRPLPYLYLARDVFADTAIPFEALDTLPLAAEPYAAAVDLALEAVATDFTRVSLLALLRSPHFVFDGGSPLTAASVAAFDFALADARYLGGFERLESLVAEWEDVSVAASREQRRQLNALPAARAALRAATPLHGLTQVRRLTDQVATLLDWLQRFDRPVNVADSAESRRNRVRAAVLGVLGALAGAYYRHDPDGHGDVTELTRAIRRWLGGQTFATSSGSGGLQIVDAQAARYGDFDDIQIVGLIDTEWPERTRGNVLYPSSLMSLIEPQPAMADPARRERDTLRSARARFKDLLFSANSRVRLSTFALENDAVVEPSILLDDVAEYGLPTERADPQPMRVSYAEALALEPRLPHVLPSAASAWAAARLSFDDRDPSQFRGEVGPWTLPRVSVSRLERYLDCPFRFFASEVLKLEEQPEDEDTRTPLERGRFLHELWERFFAEWQRRGHGRIEPERLLDARALFEELCEEALSHLPPAEAALERNRLLGSAVSPGIAHRVFAMEANRQAPIIQRLLEFPLQDDFTFRTRAGEARTVRLSGKADRIDVLADRTLRVIDYKSKKTPDPKQALQLPIYSFCARESLHAKEGGAWTIAEALYLSFEGDKPVVALRAKGRTTEELLDEAQERLLTTLDQIAAGRFPASPTRRALCGPCPYRAVCRLEIVETAEQTTEQDTAVTQAGTPVPLQSSSSD